MKKRLSKSEINVLTPVVVNDLLEFKGNETDRINSIAAMHNIDKSVVTSIWRTKNVSALLRAKKNEEIEKLLDEADEIEFKKRTTISDDQKNEVKNLLILGKTYDEIAEATNVSKSSISRIKNDNKDDINPLSDADKLAIIKASSSGKSIKDISRELEISREVIRAVYKEFGINNTNNADDIEIFQVKNSIAKAGLVAERHDIPVKSFIYTEVSDDGLSYDDLFNFDKQLKICNDYIDSRITFDENGLAEQKLIVYVTGWSSCLASMIKACSERKVNLSLMHYDKDDKITHYKKQEIFTDFDMASNADTIFSDYLYFHDLTTIYTLARKPEDFTAGDYYALSLTSVDAEDESFDDYNFSEADTFKRDLYIAEDIDTIMDLYNKMIRDIRSSDDKCKIYVNPCSIEDNGRINIITEIISMSSNYKSTRKPSYYNNKGGYKNGR